MPANRCRCKEVHMIHVSDLQMVFPNGYEALKQVSFSVEKSQLVCIIGRSGAGKSTLLRCLNGMLTPTSGRVEVAGVDVTAATETEKTRFRKRVGFVFQEYNLVDRLPVMTNVLVGRLGYTSGFRSMFGIFPHEDRMVALNALEQVRLLERAGQRADSLSGGEKQRVALARALAQDPVVLLADEPVASLDVELAHNVMEHISRVAKRLDVPTLVNIHDVALAREFADRIIGIAKGEVVYDGSVAGLTQSVLDRVYRFDREPAELVRAGESNGKVVPVTA